MIFKFLILSDEVDDFRREIQIDADDTFLQLYTAILNSTGFSDENFASFFICDDRWRRKQEITLIEMDTSSEEDSYTMEGTVLSDLLEDEKQKLMLVFDHLNDRALYIELSELIPGKNLKKPVCTLSVGEAPAQMLTVEDVKVENSSLDLGETFFGDESFEMDELDKDGFDGLEDAPAETDSGDLF